MSSLKKLLDPRKVSEAFGKKDPIFGHSKQYLNKKERSAQRERMLKAIPDQLALDREKQKGLARRTVEGGGRQSTILSDEKLGG